MLSKDLPSLLDVEVTLIGPGYGECALLHIEGSWIIIDSCRSPVDRGPAAAAYLDYLGVEPEAVKLIVCTHWHDDHIAGIAALHQKFQQANFCFSGALRSEEFLQVVSLYKGWDRRGPIPVSSGLTELTEVMESLRSKKKPPTFAHANRTLWQSASGRSAIASLSPSDEMVLKSKAQIAALMPAEWANQHRLQDDSPNHIAVALHVRAGAHSILLGSDLEEHGDVNVGWSAVVGSDARPQSKASLYKVAHHGSITGEHPGVWSELLSPGPVTLLTPFRGGRSNLPTPAQAAAISGRSGSSFVTARAGVKSVKRRNPVTRQINKNRLELVQGRYGMLRARIGLEEPGALWKVELAGDAVQL